MQLRVEANGAGGTYMPRVHGSVSGKRESGPFWNALNCAGLMPREAAAVHEDFERATLAWSLKDWTQILCQSGLCAAAIKVLRR